MAPATTRGAGHAHAQAHTTELTAAGRAAPRGGRGATRKGETETDAPTQRTAPRDRQQQTPASRSLDYQRCRRERLHFNQNSAGKSTMQHLCHGGAALTDTARRARTHKTHSNTHENRGRGQPSTSRRNGETNALERVQQCEANDNEQQTKKQSQKRKQKRNERRWRWARGKRYETAARCSVTQAAVTIVGNLRTNNG